jgi:hypothetical protein
MPDPLSILKPLGTFCDRAYKQNWMVYAIVALAVIIVYSIAKYLL